MTPRQFTEFSSKFDMDARKKLLQRHGNALAETPLEAAGFVARVFFHHHELLSIDWAREMVFALLPSLKMGDPEKAARCMESEEHIRRHLLPLWRLMRGDGHDTDAARASFGEQCEAAIRNKVAAIAVERRELKELKDQRDRAQKRIGADGPGFGDRAMICPPCLQGWSPRRYSNTELASKDAYLSCQEHRCRYQFAECPYADPETGERCGVVTCASFRDPDGMCPRHTRHLSVAKGFGEFEGARGAMETAERPRKQKLPLRASVVAARCRTEDDDKTPYLPALAVTLPGGRGLVWPEQCLADSAQMALLLRLVVMADDEFEVGGDRLLYLGGKATHLRVVSPSRCRRGVEPLCDATPERVEALVDAMRAAMERHHPEALEALTLVADRRAANLEATDVKIPPVFEITEAMKRDRVAICNMAMDFAPRKRRSPVEGVEASVYIAHEAGGDNPAQVARELTERAAAKARGIKELQRKLYRLYALLHRTGAMIGVESASFRVDGLYGREDSSAVRTDAEQPEDRVGVSS